MRARFLGRLLLLGLAIQLTWVAAAAAHIQTLRGRLIEVVRQSTLVVIARIEQVTPRDSRTVNATARIDRTLLGSSTGDTLELAAPIGLAVGQRHVLFLHTTGGRWMSVAPSGALFPASPSDDSAYQEAITRIRSALDTAGPAGTSSLRAALISALSAPAPTLRYYAAIELTTLDAHGGSFDAQDRAALQRIVDDPSADPTLRPLVAALLQRTLP